MLSHIPNITQLSSNVVRILGCNPSFYTLQGTNTYLIGNGKNRILFDTGEKDNQEYLNILKNYLIENNLHISSIIISHWHSDHMLGLPNLVKNLKLEDIKIYKMKHEKDIPNQSFNYIDKELVLKESDITVKIRLIPTPGHTSDHLILHLEDDNVVLSGDCILGEGSSVFEDLSDYINSLKLISNLNPSKIYPGHGKVIDNPIEKINETINHRLQREKKILDALNEDKQLSIEEIVDIIYKNQNIPSQLYEGCIYNVTNHLNKLLKDGKAKEIIDNEKKVYLKI